MLNLHRLISCTHPYSSSLLLACLLLLPLTAHSFSLLFELRSSTHLCRRSINTPHRKHITWRLSSQSTGALAAAYRNTRHVTATHWCDESLHLRGSAFTEPLLGNALIKSIIIHLYSHSLCLKYFWYALSRKESPIYSMRPLVWQIWLLTTLPPTFAKSVTFISVNSIVIHSLETKQLPIKSLVINNHGWKSKMYIVSVNFS
jgi:hypothetical protein